MRRDGVARLGEDRCREDGRERDPRTSDLVRSNVKDLRAGLDPVQLLAEIRSGQQTLVAIADRTIAPSEPNAIADFLAGLRTAWRTGEVRPTAQLKPKLKRERRRPDPLITVTDELRSWFEADPAQTGRDLLERLQATYSDTYLDGLIRTVQRRLKIWRGDIASRLVFGISRRPPPAVGPGTSA